MTPIIDSHAHIYLPEFDADRDALLQTAAGVGVAYILMPAIDSTTHEAMLDVEKANPSCLAMMGLHPCSVGEDPTDELEVAAAHLAERPFVAIGETGLDLYWDKTYLTQQYAAFHRQIGWALEHDLPIVIHSRESTAECIDVVRQYPGLRGVFHCFSGSAEQAQAIVELGFFLGIGGVVTFKNAGLDKIVAAIGLENLLLETDAPYLAPVPFRGKRNIPEYVALVAKKLGVVKNIPEAEVGRITTENAINLFKLRDKP